MFFYVGAKSAWASEAETLAIVSDTVLSGVAEKETPHEKAGHGDSDHEKFNPGEFIFDHIGDSYEWQIITFGETHVSIPLPVILYSKEQGLVAFWSSKFKHGHKAYKGFRVEAEGDHKGKIVEALADGSDVLPFDISITKNVASLFISVFVILLIFIRIGNAYKRNPIAAPKGIQSILEPIILFVRDDVAKPSIGAKYEKFMPYLLTVFFFIWINNMLGLIPIFPGGANVTGNIAVTMVLALATFTITTIKGNKNYWKHIFNAPGVPIWLKVPPLPIMPLVETIGIFIKPLVLMIRLFANITAGHIIGLGFISLIFLFGEMNQYLGYGVSVVSVFFIIFMTLLELLVAFIQAYVFTFLSALYFGMAVEEHH
ncbi:MAG: F0F1 ATP synthase subunit A [Bacteroidales bacterium]|nr:F0F1 ATP synthase subunit A [Bacteroidales bacterium]